MDDFRAVAQRFGKSVQSFTKTAYMTLWMNGWARLASVMVCFLGFVTIILNTWVVSHINHRILPATTRSLAEIMERDVSLGKVRWLLPTGLVGLTHFMSVGPVEIGPGVIEKSELSVPEIKVGLSCLQSALRHELVMNMQCNDAEAKLVQADNYSWFGRPVDTTPSSSDFVPGLHKEEPPGPDVDVDSFMGLGMEDSIIQQITTLTQKLSKMRSQKERRMSQYACSTSDQTTSKDFGRHVVASLSSDVKGDSDRGSVSSGGSGNFSAMSAVTNPGVKSPMRPNTRLRLRRSEVPRRRKMSTTTRETSHGVAMKHRIHERPLGETPKHKPPSDAHRKKGDDHDQKQAKAKRQEIVEQKETESPAEAESTLVPAQTEIELEKDETADAKKDATVSEEPKEIEEQAQEDPEIVMPPEVSMEEVKSWASASWRWLTKKIKLPSVAVGGIRFDRSTILAYATQEEIPREFVNVKAMVQLGSGYHALEVDLQGDAHKRNPQSIKWTKISPAAPTHLRFVTPGAQRSFDRLFPGDITPDSIEASADLTASPAQDTSKCETAMDQAKDEEDRGDGVGGPSPFSSLSTGAAHLNPVADDGLYDVKRSPTKMIPPPSRKYRQTSPQDKTRTEGRPRGGAVRVTVSGKDLFKENNTPDLQVEITGKHLHAPMLERLIEVPIDLQEGRVNGTVHITANTPRTWQMPRIDGQVKAKDVDMHFWDAPDHISKANFELMLDNNRMYFHEATGHFGALPLIVSGDMDVDPEYGEYRLTAVVAPVEFNVARATFGLRPLPNPTAGAMRGRVHCTGSLRAPVFSGVINCIPPTREMVSEMEASHAKTALMSMPGAVGAFDKVPFTSGRVMFTHDMSTDVFTVHDFAAQPAGGGKLRGSGQIWVAPRAEKDPHALHLRCEGQGLAAHELMQRYVPSSMELPRVLDCGATNLRMTMQGSHASPLTEIKFEAPSVLMTGEATLTRTAWKGTAKAPAFDISGTLHTQFPDFESTKKIYTQTRMTKLCTPKIQGVDSDIALKGCDMLPLFAQNYTSSRAKSGRNVRLKVSGNTRIKARHIALAGQDDVQPQHFEGSIALQGLRLNQVNLAKQLTGQLEVSPLSISVNAKGHKEDEMLAFSVSLPETEEWMSSETTSGRERKGSNRAAIGPTEKQAPLKGARFSLKQGKLDVSSQVNSETNRVQMQIRGLTLDELELASLRGDLQDLSLDLNFLTREGRGEVQMTTPRYSGLLGEALSGGFRWERDIIRLEKMILQQKASRYEVQGEYALPTNLPQLEVAPMDAEGSPKWLPGDVLAATAQPYTGRWRIQVNVPNADVQEILPAMRLLNQATSVSETDYEKSKEDYLRGLEEGGVTSPPIGEFVRGLKGNKEADNTKEASEVKGGPSAALPDIQSLRGHWSGTLQAFGGGGGASTLNFNLKGDSWKWGEYEVDEAVTVGTYHSAEGAHLEEISVRTGDARFSMRGDLFGPKQDASFMLNDFPAALLSPIYKAVPALQNAVPSVTDHTQGIKRLVDGWERTKTTLGLSDIKEDTPMEKLTKGSPVNGLLFVRGTIGGSFEVPQGYVGLELYDGTIGTTQLSTANAQVALGPHRSVEFKLDSAPLESKGFLMVEGTVPLPQSQHVQDADISVRIRDGGMALVAAMVPEFKWETGNADIDFRVHGNISEPQLEGKARVTRATLSVPNLKFPLKHTYGSVRVEDGKLVVDHFESKSGNHGHIKVKGALPILKQYIEADKDDQLGVTVSKLELKVNNTYNGRLDSHLKLRRCLKEPVVSGDIEISKGTVVLQFSPFPGAAPASTTTATTAHRPAAMRFQDIQDPSSQSTITTTPVISIPKQVQMDGVQLENLKLKLGSELRFQVPFMVNLLLSGGIEVSGDPQDLTPNGEIYIDGGMVNLFATQLSMDREDSPGTVRFVPEQGFDPDLDFTLTSPAEGFKAICKGRASTWQKNVILRFRGVEGTDEENLSEAARGFQTKLADALVADDGQLALVNLAASTMATMSPRLDTWGQIGAARWRLVSAPNIPYLLTSPERLDFQDIVTSLLSGTEIEVQYGPTQAVMAHKMQGSTFGMQWNVAFNLTDNLKLSAGVLNTPSTTTSVLFQYSSEGRTKMK